MQRFGVHGEGRPIGGHCCRERRLLEFDCRTGIRLRSHGRARVGERPRPTRRRPSEANANGPSRASSTSATSTATGPRQSSGEPKRGRAQPSAAGNPGPGVADTTAPDARERRRLDMSLTHGGDRHQREHAGLELRPCWRRSSVAANRARRHAEQVGILRPRPRQAQSSALEPTPARRRLQSRPARFRTPAYGLEPPDHVKDCAS